jgi:hypothetical protein
MTPSSHIMRKILKSPYLIWTIGSNMSPKQITIFKTKTLECTIHRPNQGSQSPNLTLSWLNITSRGVFTLYDKSMFNKDLCGILCGI